MKKQKLLKIVIFFIIPFIIMGLSVEYSLCYELFAVVTALNL